MSEATDYFFEITDLQKRLGRQQVLKGINLQVRRGEQLVIIGGSGQGKSVLLKHLAGLFSPDSGSLKIDGQEIANLNERQLAVPRRKMGFLFQDGALFGSLSVWENVAFPLRETGLKDEAAIESQVNEALEAVGLSAHGDKLPGDLSGGMRKRVGLARAIVTKPQCVLYDEPTSGLDPVLSDAIDRLTVKITQQYKTTSVIVTHNMKTVFTVADRVAYLCEGRIDFLGKPAELHETQNERLRNFVEGRSMAEDL
jgi:phospholipid/cholesterol/gamma-HCH transport system ATP-binding protein